MFSKKKTLILLAVIWIIGVAISIPFLWMVDFITNPDQCQLNMNYAHLVYVLGLNILFIFVPAICLAILYIYIILIIKRRFANFAQMPFIKSLRRKDRSIRQNRSAMNSNKRIKYNKDRNPKEVSSYFAKPSVSKNKLRSSMNNSIETSYNNLNVNESICLDGLTKKAKTKKIDSINSKTSVDKKFKLTALISLITIIFFLCVIPIRVFLCWSYLNNYFSPIHLVDDHMTSRKIFFINLFSNLATLVYFLHCISNPIIYNAMSVKFRIAFINFLGLKLRCL